MPDDLVSVIVPTYYRNDRLRDTIGSVEAQTYDPIETIVVDDSGEAHARPVADEFDVRYLIVIIVGLLRIDRATSSGRTGTSLQ